MAADKIEGNNFDAVIKAPTVFANFLRTAFDGANGGDSGAAIKSMLNTAASQSTVSEIFDAGNPPSFNA